MKAPEPPLPARGRTPAQDEIARLKARRDFITKAAAGTLVAAIGGTAYYLLSDSRGEVDLRADGKPRLPPGQRAAAPVQDGSATQSSAADPSRAEPITQPSQSEPAQLGPKLTDAELEPEREVETFDGRPTRVPRMPPNQEVIRTLRDMGGRSGNPSYQRCELSIGGEVSRPLKISWEELLKLPQVDQTCDVHCVTGWSVLNSLWRGVRISHLADLAGVKSTARHVIFECAHGYTANVLLDQALAKNALIAHHFDGKPMQHKHGSPVRSLVPDLYFWKSSKWLTGIQFTARDEPGYWEVRGYHNHADPWKEERYA